MRLKEISKMELQRDDLLMKLGAARAKAPAAWRLLDVEVAAEGATFSYALNRKKLRKVWRRDAVANSLLHCGISVALTAQFRSAQGHRTKPLAR